MNDAFGSPRYVGSRNRSTCIGYKTYTGRISNTNSKPKPIHGTFHNTETNS